MPTRPPVRPAPAATRPRRPLPASRANGGGVAQSLPETLEFMRQLWQLVHYLERTSKQMARDIGVTGPQRVTLRVLGLLPRASAGELAAVLHVHPSTLTGILERLVAQKLVTRVADPGDRRRAVLTLTAKGAKVNALRRGTAEATISEALKAVSAADLRGARRVIQAVTGSLAGTADRSS